MNLRIHFPSSKREEARRRIAQVGIVLAGLVVGQAILYWPSLTGKRVLLPVDYLALRLAYIPWTPEIAKIQPSNLVLSDLVTLFEPARRFAVSEWGAGRLPMWAPYQYGGVPFIWPKFSPFLLFECSTASPIILAWGQLIQALVAGLGAYLFFRRALSLSFWPAAFAAWCYPLTAFFVFWQGFPTSGAVYWLPWMLFVVERTVRAPSGWAPLGLSLVTALTVVSGHLDVAAQVLLVSGLYALWCLVDPVRLRLDMGEQRFPPGATALKSSEVQPTPDPGCQPASEPGKGLSGPSRSLHMRFRAVGALAAGFSLGLLLAAPYVLPVWEYTRTGERMVRRRAGLEERPPIGVRALPAIGLPDMYGSSQPSSVRIVREWEIEGAEAGYVGLLAVLLPVALAWCSPRYRFQNLFWALLVLFGLAWCLNVPGVVQLFRLRGLNLLSYNRLVFAAAFALLAMAATGLEVFAQGPLEWRWGLWCPAVLSVLVGGWCLYRTFHLPELVARQLETIVAGGGHYDLIKDLAGVRRAQAWFAQHYVMAAWWSAVAVCGWVIVWRRQPGQSRWLPVLGLSMTAELLLFASGRNPQCDPALYYPRLPVLEQLAHAGPGRVIGCGCLPASLASMCGLQDIRGYDAVDPARMVELLATTVKRGVATPSYASTQWLRPGVTLTPEGDARLSPLLDMLGVRYVIFRNAPEPGTRPVFQGTDYWVLQNPSVLPRAFVPTQVESVPDPRTRLEKLSAPEFDARKIAYVESPTVPPAGTRGSSEMIVETSTRLVLSWQMETPGLLVVADAWDPGWRAYLDGAPVPVLRVNHALRGVVLPAGTGTLEFRFEPTSFARGTALCAAAAAVLLAWIGSRLGSVRFFKKAAR